MDNRISELFPCIFYVPDKSFMVNNVAELHSCLRRRLGVKHLPSRPPLKFFIASVNSQQPLVVILSSSELPSSAKIYKYSKSL